MFKLGGLREALAKRPASWFDKDWSRVLAAVRTHKVQSERANALFRRAMLADAAGAQASGYARVGRLKGLVY